MYDGITFGTAAIVLQHAIFFIFFWKYVKFVFFFCLLILCRLHSRWNQNFYDWLFEGFKTGVPLSFQSLRVMKLKSGGFGALI